MTDEIKAGKIKVHRGAVRGQRHANVSSRGASHELVFSINGTPPPVPLVFGILAGEAVYQLRSALDHLVYQLIVAHTKNPPTFNSAFPVVGKGATNRKGVWQTAPQVYEAQTSRLKNGISSAALKTINQLQPFHRGAGYEADPLWMLTDLNNTDKHRVLNLTVHGVSGYSVLVTFKGERLNGFFEPVDGRFEDGAELGRMPLPHGDFEDQEVSMNGELVIAIAFQEICGRRNVPLIPFLTQLADYVEGTIKLIHYRPCVDNAAKSPSRQMLFFHLTRIRQCAYSPRVVVDLTTAAVKAYVARYSTQAEAARALGISPQYLGNLLRGQRNCSQRILAKLGLQRLTVIVAR